MQIKSWLKTSVVGGLAALGIVGATAPSASAYIACNRWHQCWHVRTQYAYPAALRVAIYPDTWRWRGSGWRWARDRDDRGYYYRGAWRRF